MNNNSEQRLKDLARLPTYLAATFYGEYGTLCELLEEIERKRPDNVKMVYQRFSPSKPIIRVEGEV